MSGFGENLQFYRKQRELTQEQLAEQLDVSGRLFLNGNPGRPIRKWRKYCSFAIYSPVTWIL